MNKKILEFTRIIIVVSVFVLITVSEFDAIYLSLLKGLFDIKRFIRTLNLFEPVRNFILLFLVSFILSLIVKIKTLDELKSKLNFHQKKLAILLVLLFLALSSYVAYFILDAMPHTGDGACYLFQAKIFKEGKLSWLTPPYRFLIDCGIDVQAPEPNGRFVSLTLDTNGKWYTRSPPGYPIFLMFGLLVGQPWIINPIAGALFLFVLYLTGKEVYDEKTALIALILGVFSPFIILMSSEFLSHAITLLFISLFILFLVKTLKEKNSWYPSLSGAALGIAFNSRPFTAVGASVPLVLYLVYVSIKNRRLKSLFYFVTALMFFVLIFFVYYGIQTGWRHLTAESQLFNIYGGGFGFKGDYHDPNRIHTFEKAIAIVNVTHIALNKFLFIWPIPALFFVLTLFLTKSRNTWDTLFIASHFGLVGAYFFWYSTGTGPGYGPRFQYESVLPLLLLSARGIIAFPRICPSINAKKTAAIFIILLVAYNLFSIPSLLSGYKNHRGYGRYLKDGVEKRVLDYGAEKAVVIAASPYWFTVMWNPLRSEKEKILYTVSLDAYHEEGMSRQLVKYFFPGRECFNLNVTSTLTQTLIADVVSLTPCFN